MTISELYPDSTYFWYTEYGMLTVPKATKNIKNPVIYDILFIFFKYEEIDLESKYALRVRVHVK